MSPRTRTTVIVLVALVLAVVSRIFLPVGPPQVSVRAEPLFGAGTVFPFTNSFLMTLLVDIVLIAVAAAATSNMQLVPRGLQNFMEFAVESLYNLFRGINRQFVATAFPLVATIFFFVLLSNWLALVPGVGSIGICEQAEHAQASDTRLALRGPAANWLNGAAPAAQTVGAPSNGCGTGQTLVPLLRSPSADLNNTLALSVAAVFFIEYMGFRTQGVGYLSKFFNLRGVMSVVGIFEFIGEIARLPAFMFRLFGNIFAGEVVLLVMSFLVPFFLPLPFYAFELLVGFIQAFVFAVLTMAFISIAVESHEQEHGPGDHA